MEVSRVLIDARRGGVPRADLARLLAAASFDVTDAHLSWLIDDLYTGSGVDLYGWLEGERAGVSAVIGLRHTGPHQAEILHLAVAEQHRRKGIGRRVVESVVTRHQLRTLVAETDAEAVGFYRQLGFVAHSLGHLYAGVERFLCTLSVADPRL